MIGNQSLNETLDKFNKSFGNLDSENLFKSIDFNAKNFNEKNFNSQNQFDENLLNESFSSLIQFINLLKPDYERIDGVNITSLKYYLSNFEFRIPFNACNSLFKRLGYIKTCKVNDIITIINN